MINVWGLLALPLVVHAILLFWSAQDNSLLLSIKSEQALAVQLDLDTGSQYGKPLRFQTHLVPSKTSGQEVRFAVPPCTFRALRLHFLADGKPVSLKLGGIQVISAADEALGWDPIIEPLPAAGFVVEQQAVITPAEKGWVQIDTLADGDDPACLLTLATPLELGFNATAFAVRLAIDLLAYLLIGAGALVFWRRSPRAQSFTGKIDQAAGRAAYAIGRFCRTHPRRAIWLAGLAGVLVSCYPIVFCGKSFISPNLTLPLFYDHLPTVPGYNDATYGYNQRSDVAAIMLQQVPWTVNQHRALFHEHELPVWNRYDAGGIPLLGQGQSMIGDPLHWIPLLANSASWAWDLKYLIAKWLFAVGIGFAVWMAARHLPSALLLAFSGCFIGFFICRLNHPSYFSFCYAPWIICAWQLITLRTGRREIGFLLLANWMVFNSGTVKEAMMLLLNMNACGALIFWLAEGRSWRRFLPLGFAGLCFTLVTAPFWLTLLNTIAHSWNDYKTPGAWQVQPGLLIGLFDDIFFRQFNYGETLYNSGLNFVAFLGIACSVAYFKTLVRDTTWLALTLGALPSLALMFGVVPPDLIKATPFLGNIVNIDVVFSCPLMILTLILSGYGLRECFQRFQSPTWGIDLAGAAVTVGLLFGAFVGLIQAVQRSSFDPHTAMRPLEVSPFAWIYITSLVLALFALPLVLRQMRREQAPPLIGYVSLAVLCLAVMLWRHGLQLPGLSLRYVMSPGVRVDLRMTSPAIRTVLARQQSEPGRTMGFGSHLAPGFIGIYGFESPSGADALQNDDYHDLLLNSGVRYWSGWYLVADRPAFSAAHKFFDALNIRYFLDAPRHASLHGDLASLAREDLDVYESNTAWPRAFFTDTISTYRQPAEFCDLINRGDGRPFVAIEESSGELKGLGQNLAMRQVTPATDYRLTSRTTSFRIRAPGAGVIALLEGYQGEGVKVTLNGAPAPHFKVNAAFSGVYVPRGGEYTVSFRYWPPLLTVGLWMALIGVGMLAVFFIRLKAPSPSQIGQIPAPAGSGPAAATAPTGAP